MKYVFDIDGTICKKEKDANYEASKPLFERIDIVNFLYDSGNTIIMYTARGMGRHENDFQKVDKEFRAMTANQLKEWGVKHHHLFLGKPNGDYYIDDKGIKDEDFFTD